MIENYSEKEFKYDISAIGLTKFQELMLQLGAGKPIEVSSWDHYLTNDKDEFIRFRKSDTKPELTIKRKLSSVNNNDRIEVNLPVATSLTDETVTAFSELLGYKHNFKIFKSCWIYYFDNVDIVYYIVFSKDMKEVGRFLEIEILEDKHVANPFDVLKEYEQKLSPLGIKPQNRLRKSLFEMNRV
jgi:adenylate cyclase class IV